MADMVFVVGNHRRDPLRDAFRDTTVERVVRVSPAPVLVARVPAKGPYRHAGEDLSGRVLHDDVFARLLTFPNVLVTGHQAFFTREALTGIAETTIANVDAFAADGRALHEVSVERLA